MSLESEVMSSELCLQTSGGVKFPTDAFHDLWIPPTLIARRKKAFKKNKNPKP